MNQRRAYLVGLLAALAVPLLAGGLSVDRRYAPERQYTLLSFPFDWQKSIILGNGNLAFDFGPGPYHAPGTEIGIGIAGSSIALRNQFFADPLVAVATSEFRSADTVMTQESFSLVPSSFSFPASFSSGRIRRLGHLAGTIAWADPAVPADPAFRNVAWGTNRPIVYRVKVSAGSAKTVALGLCEAYKPGPGQRTLELRVEGADPQTVDPMKGGEKNRPFVFLFKGCDVNKDGELSIEVHSAPESPDPNVILNALWVFPEGLPLTPEAVLRGDLSQKAEVYWQCGTERASSVTRTDALIATFGGPEVTPALMIMTHRPVVLDSATGVVSLGEEMRLRCSPAPRGSILVSRRWILPFPPGTRRVEVLVDHTKRTDLPAGKTDIRRELGRAEEYWSSRSPIPRGKIVVPDSALQGILDVNIRNLYQAADRVDGYPVFQPGPTVYRGLWLLDLMLIGEPLMLLGDMTSARKFIEGAFRYQQGDGRVRVVTPYNSWLETPAFICALGRYARWTGDRLWMAANWKRMVKGIEWIRRVRASTMSDTSAPAFGLFPPGFVDGGQGGSVSDFGSAAFGLMALETGAGIAAWLGHRKEAREWRALFDDLMASYVRAARRNLRTDRSGTAYLPTAIGDTSKSAPPQRGQFGFLMALRYSTYFSEHIPFLDTLVAGNLTMLDSTLREGMVADAGWTRDAVWSWFGAMHAVTLSWRGEHARALQMLYDVANHAGRLGTWVEEQQIAGKGTTSTGDGANAEASAYFITALRHLLVYERGKTTELLPGVPAHWYVPGAGIALSDVPTRDGRLTLTVRVAKDGRSLRLRTSFLPGAHSDGASFTLSTAMMRAAGFTSYDGGTLGDTLVFGRSPPTELVFTRGD